MPSLSHRLQMVLFIAESLIQFETVYSKPVELNPVHSFISEIAVILCSPQNCAILNHCHVVGGGLDMGTVYWVFSL